MTNERKNGDGTFDTDELVSQTYRELAGERVPDRLNQAILRQAAKPVRRPYAMSMLWTKPLAWAATIAICLAITLQVTQLPDPGITPLVPMPAAAESKATINKEQAETKSAADTDSRRQEVRARAPAEDSVAEQDSEAAIVRDTPEKSELKRTVPSFEVQDADMLRRADEMVRLQSGSTIEPEEVPRSAFAASPVAAFDAAAGCDDDATAQPETWQSCIDALEKAGLTEMAAHQREQLAEAFPDFEAP